MRTFILIAMLIAFPLNSSFAHSNNEFLDTVDKVRTSIVLVESKREAESAGLTPLDEYLKEEKDEEPPTPTSIGTGFVVEGGYIITNNHVIDNSIDVVISFENSSRRFAVDIIGTDKLTDIAVLKTKEPLPLDVEPLAWASIGSLRAGMDVWAIGHPRGLDYTVSKGIISHLKRRIVNGWQTVIQSDVSINRGNSGGPLLDMDGNVIAINTMILSADGGSDGLSMSVDNRVAQWAIKKLINGEKIERPKMGISLKFDYEMSRVLAASIEENSAAAKVGVLAEDIIMKAGGQDINNIEELFDALQYKAPGDSFPLLILRGEELITFPLVLGKLEPESDSNSE